MSLEIFKEKYDDVSTILVQLHLSEDRTLQDQMVLIKIELEAAMYNLPETNHKIKAHLEQIHLERLNSNLYKILESALGYYALVDQVKGSNEPLIGPVFSRTLLEKLKSNTLDLSSLKDELHTLIGEP